MVFANRARVHLDENAVAAFLGGQLPPNEASGIREHLDAKLGHLARPVLEAADEHEQVVELDAWLPH